MEQYYELPLEDDIGLLEESLQIIEDRSDRMVAYFYAGLFLENPELRGLFGAAMDTQRDRLFRALTRSVRNLRDTERFVTFLHQLGRDHRKYGVRTEHYEQVGRALLNALRKYCDDVWVPELEAAWWRAYNYMAVTMIEGAQEAASREPAWWKGEIIAHERRTEDIAVITVRTDRPYDYQAGQFASIETTYRPRTWRNYSMATAPSPGGLLEFHVKAVGAGWVSGPLVWRAMVGDALRIGAPMGDMTVDPNSHRDILFVAGGTGLAPVKAMVDDLTKWNTSRRVHVFFGARQPNELYDIAALHRLAAPHRWLTIVPAVSDEPRFNGERGMLCDVIQRHGEWSNHDVYVAGSPDMTRATLTRLGEMGVPPEHIHYDAAGDVHPAAAQVIDLRRTRASRERSGSPSLGSMHAQRSRDAQPSWDAQRSW